MIPPSGILIGFRLLHWGAGHLPNHLTLMTRLDMLNDSIEVTSKDMWQHHFMCSFSHRAVVMCLQRGCTMLTQATVEEHVKKKNTAKDDYN